MFNYFPFGSIGYNIPHIPHAHTAHISQIGPNLHYNVTITLAEEQKRKF